ncbi:MAG: flavin-containing monooxygenase, partial [Ilumatobacteraceae bacterium]
RSVPSMSPAQADRQVDVVVVGAGFSGMYLLHRLRQLVFTTQVFEAAGDVGGTWYWNRYPGARCDVESLDYSYSFDPDLEQEWDWTERYSTQPEILAYADHVAERFDLRSGIEFDTKVTSAVFDESTGRWAVSTDGGKTVSAQFVVLAVGCLSAAKDPEVPGLGAFDGPTYHTGRWPHEGVDFTGQRVGVIGTGSSGIQSIPLIAEQAAHLTVFQRTPNFSMPAQNAPLDPAVVAERKANYREHRQQAKHSPVGVLLDIPDELALEADPDERAARFRAGWERGFLFGISGSYGDLLLDPAANELAAEFIREQIRQIVDDPDVAETLSPRNHPFGTKRPCLDTGYYATFNRENVTLVDLRRDPIVEITPTGIRTADGDIELDAIVFATGFDAMTGPIIGIDIVGRAGQPLREKWAAGPRTYLGLATAGFPNLFTITGPGSPSVLSNMMVSIEQHVDWVTDCLADLRQRGVATIEATVAAEDGWVAHVNEVADTTLMPRANSWYMGANVPGKPRVFMPYVGGVGIYREICDTVAAKDYDGFDLT